MRIDLLAATRRVLFTVGVAATTTAVATAYDACQPCYPQSIVCPPAVTPEGDAAPTPGVQPLAPDASVDLDLGAQANNQPPVSSVASSSRSQASFAPNMIGDFFGSNASWASIAIATGFITDDTHYAVPGAGDIVGRPRIQDNNSAMPQDRVYVDYNYFHNARVEDGDYDVNRVSFGVEKTFRDGRGSIELRVPTAATLDDFQDDIDLDRGYQLGNILINTKMVLAQNCETTWAAGLGFSLPTADGYYQGGITTPASFYSVENEALHLIPYIAVQHSPNCSNFFYHGFVTLDFATSGNAVVEDFNGDGAAAIGDYEDQHIISLDFAMGQWLYRDNSCYSWLNGLAWSGELHYSASLSEGDAIPFNDQPGGGVVRLFGNPTDDLSVLNGVIGTHAQIGATTCTLAYTLPLSDQSDRTFDGEVRVFLNRAY